MTILICCLGNPGETYTKTRHNIGFQIADALINKFSFTKAKKKFNSHLYEGHIGEQKILIQKPQTFMNLSGQALNHAMTFYKLPSENCVVIYDDVDIPFGHLRFRQNGGAGTHNGMRSIIAEIKTKDFPRLRVGVGPIPPRWDVSDFVLSNFISEEQDHLPELFKRCSSFFSDYFTGDHNNASKQLHTHNPKEKPNDAKEEGDD